ncbi:hypothetical protein [Rhodopirellula halodulae]|uniref:hypothetical protein n=1 Tax=Rhodopirellula halodulae TaxID=2894198 RepID=UPI001E3451B7|nr:hypothetical protein [Rhodopirellula sp. JC737]MCC9657797.1 hypothetical protein [Rhodopirellula sp. JC737]
MIRFSILAIPCLLACLISSASAGSIPGDMPHTRLLDSDLAQIQTDCEALRGRLTQLRQQVKTARDGVGHAIDATKTIRSMDKKVKDLVDDLQPYTSIPKVRTLARTLRKNLERIQEQLHTLRKKTDKAEEDVLRPMRDRLRSMEQTIFGAEQKLVAYSRTITQRRQDLQGLVSRARSVPGGVPAAESVSRVTRPSVQTFASGLRNVRQQVDRFGNGLTQLNAPVRVYMQVDQSLISFDKKLAPAEKTVAKLEKTLGKELTIKVPFSRKKLQFSIREILEAPGKILGVVLKPLEALADKVLQPVLKELKVEIKAPKGLEELARELNSLPALQRSMQREADQFQRSLEQQLEQSFRTLLTKSLKFPAHLVSHRSDPRDNEPRDNETIRQTPPSSPAPKRNYPVMFFQVP